MAESDRIDKVLWALRIYKTRTEATEACKGGKVKIDGSNVKPSRLVKTGDTINVHKGIIQYSYKLIQIPPHRLGAKLVPDYAENLTSQEELDKLRAPVETFFLRRDRGTGRPTKKERREMEEAWDKFDIASSYGMDYDDDLE
ncbi:MAG: RNA-binding S4 domain-containing protein [Bacteroidales bacterium]|nr:RNA-binding S4 domain-containing protein [Bacteroidales bacterium]